MTLSHNKLKAKKREYNSTSFKFGILIIYFKNKLKYAYTFPSIRPPMTKTLCPTFANAKLMEETIIPNFNKVSKLMNENRIEQTHLFLEELYRNQFRSICSFCSRIFKFWKLKLF